jgi:hypothetical protein
MDKELIINDNLIKDKIHYIRGKQVILDRDIAKLYGIQTGRLNEQVKRNKERFPGDFCFQLYEVEYQSSLRSQIATLEKGRGKHRKYLPYVFTEQGVAMLSSVLKSKKAIEVNIKIMRAFISMRKFLIQNHDVFNRLDNVERKQIEYQIKSDKNFEKVFDALSLNEPKQGIFFDGQIFDAYLFLSNLIKKAKNEIILIDNYIDENTLYFFTKTSVKVKILTKNIPEKEIKKYNEQYKNIEIKYFDKSHDRFLIIDNDIYHLGASLKDAGKKWFVFNKMEDKDLLKKLP